MTGWHAERMPGRSAKAVIAVTLLALLLVAAVPVALLAAVVTMLLGHVGGGLALFGGSVLAAAIAVALAGVSVHGTCASWSPSAAPLSCSRTAASTPKSADLTVPLLVRIFGLDIWRLARRTSQPGAHSAPGRAPSQPARKRPALGKSADADSYPAGLSPRLPSSRRVTRGMRADAEPPNGNGRCVRRAAHRPTPTHQRRPTARPLRRHAWRRLRCCVHRPSRTGQKARSPCLPHRSLARSRQ